MESDAEDSDERLLSFNEAVLEPCAFCRRVPGMKLPFCRGCARVVSGISQQATYVHRSCAEKRMNKDRRLKCPQCESTLTMYYSGALHDDYALRNMREAFHCCFPSAERTLAFNFISVKHTLLALISFVLLFTNNIVASQVTGDTLSDSAEGNSTDGWLVASKVLITAAFSTFLISWFISSSNALLYVILYGSVRKAKQQLVMEITLYICIAALGLIGAVNWRTVRDAEMLFGVWSVLVPLIMLALVIIATIEKVKTYSHLALIGISMQVQADP